MERVIKFYSKYEEENRLTTNKARMVEFDLTTHLLDPFIKPSDHLLELGAGTGIYSFYFATQGVNVVASDITPKHVKLMEIKKMQMELGDQIQPMLLNATDLSSLEDASFDHVLNLGPFYHLIQEEDRRKALNEALRVLKPGGKLAIAYINKQYVLHSAMLRNNKYLNKHFIDQILTTGVIKEEDEFSFWTDAYFTTPTEMETFLSDYPLEIKVHAATDGITPLVREPIDKMDFDEYETWLYYFKQVCQDSSIIGMSNHVLVICEKIT